MKQLIGYEAAYWRDGGNGQAVARFSLNLLYFRDSIIKETSAGGKNP